MKTLLTGAALAFLALPAFANAGGHGGHHGKADANGDGIVTLAEHQTMVAKHFAAMDGNGDGQVTETEMKAAHEARMDAHKAKLAERMAERHARMEEKLADASPEERAKMEEMHAKHQEMRTIHREMRAERHAEMWASVDADGNGAISLTEFQAHAGERFAKMDANSNGQIDADEKGKDHRGMRHHQGTGAND